MNAEKYVNDIVGKIKCTEVKKKEIKTQLLSDISARMEQGESLEQIMESMGTVQEIADALEVVPSSERKDRDFVVMTTRYCLRRELGCCKKAPKDKAMFAKLSEPLSIVSGPNVFRLEFDCKNCEMNVIGNKKR